MNRAIKLLLIVFLCALTAGAREIRVGITEYQNIELVYLKYQRFFDELERIAREKKTDVTFRFAIGTYSEVIDWYNKELIDVAVLSALPIADLLTTSDATDRQKIRESFLAKLNPVGGSTVTCQADPCRRSLDEPSAQCASSSAQSQTARSQYHVSAVVPAEYGWKTFADVRKHAGQKKLKFLFVRPVSISGYIAPSYYLKEVAGINPEDEDYDFTYQHQESLQRIIRKDQSDADKFVVAFVIENTAYCVPQAASDKQFFTKLEAEGLSSIDIPHEVMLVNSNLDEDSVKEVKDTMDPLLTTRAERQKNGTPKSFTLTLLDPKQVNWLEDYKQAQTIYESTRGTRPLAYGSSFEDLINSLKTYEESTGEHPRLALVLSGGGAKCAYQAGAVSQIEDKLRELKNDPKYDKIDFDLVVGTSGGAINALLVALGGTRDVRTQPFIRDMWTSFHQEHFFRPSRIFNVIFGLCFGLLQALAITFAVLLFGRKRLRWTRIGQLLLAVEVMEIGLAAYLGTLTSAFALFIVGQVLFVVTVAAAIRSIRRGAIAFLATRPGLFWSRLYRNKVGDWWRIAGWLMLIVSVIEILIASRLNPSLWPTAFESHAVSHLWLLFLLTCSVSYPWPLLLGLLMVLSGIAGRWEIDWHGRRVWLVRMLTASVFLFAGILILNSLWKEPSPSNSVQIEKAFIQRVPEMLAVLHPEFAPASGKDEKEQLIDISQRIVNNPLLLKRDLVITVSNLPLSGSSEEPANPAHITANELPRDLYFFYKSPEVDSKPPPNEKRFINLRENPEKLLDVVIGSGTIYPLFPYRDLLDVNVGGGKIAPLVKVIDGGFIHNSPVEAAIKWGATHIISIEASPEPKPFAPRNTFENSLVAFSYIMAQTQRVDATVRGQAEIFELRPRSDCEKRNVEMRCNPDPEPNMDTFDFDPKIIDGAFTVGQSDAKSEMPLFKRVPGPPLFRQTRRPARAKSAARLAERKEAPHAVARRLSKYSVAAATRIDRD